MLTKAIILDRLLDNHYLVRVPVLESPNDLEMSKVEATLAHVPGIVESYKTGDVVMVGFEDHNPYKPIILGKLYLQDEEDTSRGHAELEALDVKEKVSLPNNLTIGGKTFTNVSEFFEYLQDLEIESGSMAITAHVETTAGRSTLVIESTPVDD